MKTFVIVISNVQEPGVAPTIFKIECEKRPSDKKVERLLIQYFGFEVGVHELDVRDVATLQKMLV